MAENREAPNSHLVSPGTVSSDNVVVSSPLRKKEGKKKTEDSGDSVSALCKTEDEKVEALYSKVNKRNKRVQNDSPQTHNSKAVAEEPEEAARSERPECGLNTEPNEPDNHYSPPPVPCYNPNLSDEANIYEEIEATSATLRTESDGGYVPNVTIPKELLPSFSSHSNMKAIHYAAANGSKKQLKEILLQLPLSNTEGELATKVRKGVDERDGNGRTALMHAVYNSHSHCVKLLVKHGAVVNSAAKDGSSALHHCAYSGSAEMLALLLSLGANGNLKDKDGRTPLHWCANNPDPEAMKALLDKVPDLDVNAADASLMTPLMWSAFHCKVENIKLLRESGADSRMCDIDGMTALHWSVQYHDIHALEALLDYEGSKAIDKKGKTVMHKAAEQGCVGGVALIQKVRPDSISDTDNNGRTPLHWATVCENIDTIKILLQLGANTQVPDFQSYTPLDYAREKKLQYCSLLLQRGAAQLEISLDAEGDHGGCRRSTSPLEEMLIPSSSDYQTVLTPQQVSHVKSLCGGMWMHKFTNNGKGPLHLRFFWIEPSDKTICWAKVDNKLSRDTKKEMLAGVRSSASPAVVRRKDFDPLHQHKYTFTVSTTKRVLDVVAVSSEDYKIWIQGLHLFLDASGSSLDELTRYS